MGIVVQARTVQSNISISNPEYADNELRDEVLKSKERYDNAYAELEKVNKELEEYRTKATEDDDSAAQKEEQLKVVQEAQNALKALSSTHLYGRHLVSGFSLYMLPFFHE